LTEVVSENCFRARELLGRVRVTADFPVTQMPRQVRRHSTQYYVSIPKEIIDLLNLQVGDPVLLVFPFPPADGDGRGGK